MTEIWDLPKLQGHFEGFSNGVLQRLRKLEQRVKQLEERPRECVGMLGRKLGHSFVQAFHPGTDKGHGVICSRCGYYVGNALIDGPGSEQWDAECEEFGCHDEQESGKP